MPLFNSDELHLPQEFKSGPQRLLALKMVLRCYAKHGVNIARGKTRTWHHAGKACLFVISNSTKDIKASLTCPDTMVRLGDRNNKSTQYQHSNIFS